jgi:chemotaxis methyl-accepting protein methylase
MNIIYRQEAEGKNLYAKCLHKYFIEKPAAAAVRNRAKYLKGRIKDAIKNHKSSDPIRILSVASGPAKEIQYFLTEGNIENKKIEFHLIDQDMDSLKHAQRQLYTLAKQNKNIEFHFHNTAIKNIIARGLGLKNFDLIYSAGLFDYFSEPVAQLAGQKIFEGLRKGGQLIIGNFNVENPNQFEMDLALDWRLIYRSKDDMRQLFGHLPGKMDMETENLNINLFFTITRTQ